jgi:predicted PurR-regulated permease PerM
MLTDNSTRHQRFSMILLTAAVGAGVLLCYLIALPFLPAIVWSVTLAILFAPLDNWLRKVLRARSLAAAATLAVVACIVVVPTMTVIGFLLNEAVDSAPRLQSVFVAENWTGAINNYPRLAPAIHSAVARLNLPDLLQSAAAWLAGWSSSFVQSSFSSVINLLLTFYFLFYFLRDRKQACSVARNMLPLTATEFTRLIDRISSTIFASIYGTTAVAVLQGGLGGAMFWWLDLPAPLFWGVLMGLLGIVPFLGAFVIWAPTALALALTGDLLPC